MFPWAFYSSEDDVGGGERNKLKKGMGSDDDCVLCKHMKRVMSVEYYATTKRIRNVTTS